MTESTIGRSVRRLEDPDLLRGRAQFVDDLHLDGMLHAVFLRSPHAHAAILTIDSSPALAMPGVVAVLTSEDIRTRATTDELAVALPDRAYRQERNRPILANKEAVYVGEPIAMVIASHPYLAEDAAACVMVEYDILPAASDCKAALAPDSPKVHLGASDNLVAEFTSGFGDIDTAFSQAAHVFKESYWQQRGCAHSIEGRGCVATINELDKRLTFWSSTQTPLVAARLLADILGREEDSIRVLCPDIGGGFGPKLVFYQEEAATAIAALMLRKPVKWIEDRREHFVSTTQERDQYWDAEIALDKSGKILGLRGLLLHDHGAYTARGLTTPQGSVAALTLAYDVPAYRLDVKVVLTNKVPVSPVRGAGQPQGIFVMERLLDLAADKLKIDRIAIRQRNLVAAAVMPHEKDFVTRGGIPIVLDTGDYPACQADAIERSGWNEFKARQEKARSEGRYIGIGLANYVEATGRGPYEQVNVKLASSGLVYVETGAAAMGQSTKTMLAQIVAEQIGGSMDRIRVTTGDSSKVNLGFGGFNSRQTVMAGSSAHAAAVRVKSKILEVASHLLEADAGDLEIVGDHVAVKGVGGMNISLAKIARAAAGTAGYRLPGNLPAGIEATERTIINPMTYANGTAVAEVEVDVETATIKVVRVTFVHDAGKIINPMIVDGQVMGGVVHGIGNALFEWMGYGDDAQPLTTNLADYLLMTSTEIPQIVIAHRESSTPLNPLGVKGVGESGVLPIPAAIASAVDDALAPFGVRIQQVPIRPNYLFDLLEQSRVNSGAGPSL